jgi:hypothetical protein
MDEINVGLLEANARHEAGDKQGGREVREIHPFLASHEVVPTVRIIVTKALS